MSTATAASTPSVASMTLFHPHSFYFEERVLCPFGGHSCIDDAWSRCSFHALLKRRMKRSSRSLQYAKHVHDALGGVPRTQPVNSRWRGDPRRLPLCEDIVLQRPHERRKKKPLSVRWHAVNNETEAQSISLDHPTALHISVR